MNRYLKLFSVTCKHEYYADGLTRDLAIIPTPETQKRLQQLGLLVKHMNGGFHLFYSSREGEQHVLEKLIKPETFSFTIQNQNPLFYNFTAIPFIGSNAEALKSYHFRNRNVKKKGEELALQQGDLVAETDKVLVTAMGFEYRWDEGKQPKTIKIKNETGESVFEKNIPDDPMPGVNISLYDEPNGKYNLIADGEVAMTFITVPVNPKTCFGLLQIHFGDIAAPGFELIKNGKINSQDYVLTFASQKTFLKYFFIIQNKDQYGKPEIYKGNQKADFLEAEEVTLDDGTSAYMMKSQVSLPLRQMPAESFRLRLTDSDGKNPSTIALPGPTPSQMKPETKDGNPVLDPQSKQPVFNSEIYVYI
jgi:hypothetical protein